MAEGFLIERQGDVAHLVINRPDKRNAITDAMWTQLPELVAEIEDDPAVKVLVITGAGEAAFSAGADIQEYRARVGDPEWGERSRKAVGAALEAVRGMTKPTVAAVRGMCVGGGVGLALACDLRIVEPSARFSIPPARLGLVFPFAETKALVDLVGPARAKSLLFTARMLDAEEALRIGFVDEVVPDGELMARVSELAETIASLSQFSIRASKRIIHLVLEGLSEESEETWALSGAALAGEDHAEGVAAFLEKRKPRFTYR